MSVEITHVVGAVAFWVGIFALMRALGALGRAVSEISTARAAALATAGLSGSIGACLIVVGKVFAPTERADFALPIFWPVAPFAAWAAVAALLFGVARLVAAWTVLPAQRTPIFRQAMLSLTFAVLFGWWFRSSGDTVSLVRGSMPLTWGLLAALVALGGGAVFAMAATARAARLRSFTKGIVVHLALLAGSVVFGLPFAWLLITSFKEDIDLSSPDGLVWIPRVQETAAYRDPAEPMVRTVYQGRNVEGRVMDTDANGQSTVEIRRPLALSSLTFIAPRASLTEIDRQIPIVTATIEGTPVKGRVVRETKEGAKIVEVDEPPSLAGRRFEMEPSAVVPVRKVGIRWQNYADALDFLPLETSYGLVYVKNTLLLVFLNILGTLLSSSLVAYGFARLKFPGRDALFVVLLSTMMLPAAVTMLPTFLIFRSLGWIDTLYPLWVPAFFASAFNVFLLRQFFLTLPNELEDAAKIDGCSHLKTWWSVMMPQIKPALVVIAVWTFIGTWNNFMGPLIYVNSPENMPIAYAVQLFQADRGLETGLLMAFATMSMVPVILLFLFAQKFFIEGVTLSGLGGR